jgi:UDP-N-acetyl-D-galactosamine dehydrogenase
MADYVASQQINDQKRNFCKWRPLLMLGITFKENCPDVRNTKVINVIQALVDYGITVTTHDPVADPDAVLRNTELQHLLHCQTLSLMQWF